jgi:hypothetical protein
MLASILSVHLQTLERRCLDALMDAIIRDGYDVGALIYDGLHVLKCAHLDDSDGVPKSVLKNWRAHVMYTAGYDLELKVKPLDADPSSWLSCEGSVARDADDDPKWDDSWMDGSSVMTYAKMKEVWELRAFKVTVCGDYVREEREKHAVYTRSKLMDAYEHLKFADITYSDNGEGRVKTSPFIKAWVSDQRLRCYKYIDTYPPPLCCPSHTYNMWNGFAVSKYVPLREVDTGSAGVSAIVEHLHILLDHNQAASDYVLNWIAQLFQQPSHKTGIALLLKGAEGVGKNRFTDVLKLMLGDGLFLETANLGSVLFGRFSDARR